MTLNKGHVSYSKTTSWAQLYVPFYNEFICSKSKSLLPVEPKGEGGMYFLINILKMHVIPIKVYSGIMCVYESVCPSICVSVDTS